MTRVVASDSLFLQTTFEEYQVKVEWVWRMILIAGRWASQYEDVILTHPRSLAKVPSHSSLRQIHVIHNEPIQELEQQDNLTFGSGLGVGVSPVAEFFAPLNQQPSRAHFLSSESLFVGVGAALH